MKVGNANITKDELLRLMREHKTQRAVANHIGISCATLSRLAKSYGIEWERTYPSTAGNAAWQELGR